jgi:hypothetical protein
MESQPPPTAKAGELLVFFIRRDTVCGECGQELPHGSMITLAKEKGALASSARIWITSIFYPAAMPL